MIVLKKKIVFTKKYESDHIRSAPERLTRNVSKPRKVKKMFYNKCCFLRKSNKINVQLSGLFPCLSQEPYEKDPPLKHFLKHVIQKHYFSPFPALAFHFRLLIKCIRDN